MIYGRLTTSLIAPRTPQRSVPTYCAARSVRFIFAHSGFARFAATQLVMLQILWLSASLAAAAENLGPLGAKPRWNVLERYQESITRADFERLLQTVYCTHGIPPDAITINEKSARILKNREAKTYFTLRFARNDAERKRIPRLWRPANSLPPVKREKPLSNLKIAIDPGHIGGKWAKMEERWIQVGETPPVQEGDLTLRVAKLIAPRLTALGAKISLVRKNLEPVTPLRPDDFKALARKILIRNGVPEPLPTDVDPAGAAREGTIRWQSEILFYRYSEIRRRASLINGKLHPDLVLCLHFNAEGWGDPSTPTLIDSNHLHLLVNGSYLEAELELDDVRFEMVRRLLSRVYDEELPLAEKSAEVMARQTGLPPYQYPTDKVAMKAGQTGYVYARNLLATRIYRAPVVYFEPYVMNSHDGFARIQAGDFEGTRTINGVERKSIFREYSDAVVDGLVEYYSARRAPLPIKGL